MKLKTIIYAVATALAFTACSNDSDSGSDLRDAVPLTVYGELAATTTTRVTYDDDGAGTFATGDIIYVSKVKTNKVSGEYTYEGIDEVYVNIPYQYDGSKFVPVSKDDTYYFDVTDTDDIKFIACNTSLYAYEDPNYVSMEPIDVSDQTASLVNDFIYASSAASITNPSITFEFEHRLSQVTLNFSSEITECILMGMESTKAYPVFYGNFLSAGTSRSVNCHLTNDGTTAEAYIFPEESSLSVMVISNGNQFTITLPKIDFANGRHYIFNIDILDELIITSSSDDTDDTGVTIEGYTEDEHQTVTAE